MKLLVMIDKVDYEYNYNHFIGNSNMFSMAILGLVDEIGESNVTNRNQRL